MSFMRPGGVRYMLRVKYWANMVCNTCAYRSGPTTVHCSLLVS